MNLREYEFPEGGSRGLILLLTVNNVHLMLSSANHFKSFPLI